MVPSNREPVCYHRATQNPVVLLALKITFVSWSVHWSLVTKTTPKTLRVLFELISLPFTKIQMGILFPVCRTSLQSIPDFFSKFVNLSVTLFLSYLLKPANLYSSLCHSFFFFSFCLSFFFLLTQSKM